MIFVVDAFKFTVGHTLGFIGLQLALVLDAVQNSLYYTALHEKRRTERWRRQRLYWIYAVLVILVTSTKLTLSISTFAGSPVIDMKSSFGPFFAKQVDRLWMFLCAVVPPFTSFIQYRIEPPVTISLHSNQELQITSSNVGSWLKCRK